MKRKLMLTGLIAAVSAFSMSIGAIAATNLEEISAYLNKGITIKLKGQTWTPKDSDGNTLHPITYNGSTYLPVRAVGEAFGVKIGWNDETQTVFLGEDIARQPTSNSRTNPATIGSEQSFSVNDILDKYSGTITIKEVIRGDEANKKVAETNMFNEAPKDGYEYMLVKAAIKITKNEKADAAVDIHPFQFTLVSSEGKDYEYPMVVEPEPSIRTKLYAGASHEGWIVFQVKKDDINPLITFARNYDGSGGVWFKTTK